MSLIGTKKHTIFSSVSENFRLSWFPLVLEISRTPQEANAENKTLSLNTWHGNQTKSLIHGDLSLKGVCIHMIARYHKCPSFHGFWVWFFSRLPDFPVDQMVDGAVSHHLGYSVYVPGECTDIDGIDKGWYRLPGWQLASSTKNSSYVISRVCKNIPLNDDDMQASNSCYQPCTCQR